MPLLEVRDLVKVFPGPAGPVRALDGVSFTVEPGEFVVIVGLSGSGKSTLLRCINGLVKPTAGRVVFDGQDVTAASPEQLRRIRRRVGMIFQQFNLVRRASVMTNVLAGRLGYLGPWGGLTYRFSESDRKLAMANLERVGIADKADQRADTLSGGQQQRVAIARALMQKPLLLLADEPVASLDPATSHSVLKYVEEMNRQEGVTVLCSLHFLSLARRYGTRILALKAGRLVYDGPPGGIDDERFKAIYGQEAQEVEIR